MCFSAYTLLADLHLSAVIKLMFFLACSLYIC